MPDNQDKEDKAKRPTILEQFEHAAMTTAMTNPSLAPFIIGADLALNPERRERVFTGIADGVRDLFRDVPWAVVWVFDKGGETLGLDMNAGDRGYSDATAQAIEDFLDDYVKQPVGLGQAEFRLAAGWQLPPGMKYNGQVNPVYPPGKNEQQAGQPITEIRDITAIFYKNAQGEIEVMTAHDPRWMEVAGPYGGVQLLQIVASMGAGAAVKGAISMPRAITFGEKTLQTMEIAGKVASFGGKVVGTLEGASSIGQLGNQFILEPLYFKPNAMNNLTRMLSNSGTINADTANSALNTLTGQYSHLTGTMIEQIYIPSLHRGEDPWKRLDEVSLGRVQGLKRENPFDDIRDEARNPANYKPVPNTNIRDLIIQDPAFMSSYYNLVDRALHGGLERNAKDGVRLSDQEVYSLRFMINVTQDASGHMDLSKGPIPSNEHERRAIREETMDNLTVALGVDYNAQKYKAQGNEAVALHTDDPVSVTEMRSLAGARRSEWDGKLAVQTQEQEAEAIRMGQTMAMSMMP